MNASGTPGTGPVTQSPACATAFGVPLRAFLELSYWMMTNLPLVKFLFLTGLALLVVSPLSWAFSANLAFGLVIYAFITMLAIPFMIAVPLQRSLIASRRLVLVPGFALASGLALLAVVTLMSTFLPLFAALYEIPGTSSLLGPRIFVFASLYVAVVHLCMISRHALLLLIIVPLLGIVVMHRFSSVIAMMLGNAAYMLSLLTLCLGGWLNALRLLHQRNVFRAPVTQYGGQVMEQNAFEHQGSRWQPAIGQSAPAETLLHGYHASSGGKLLNLFYSVAIPPVLAAAVVRLISHGDRITLSFTQLVLFIHLFIVATFPWAWGELGPRTRLLWLRTGGKRADLWRILEHSLLRQYLLMFALTTVFVLLTWIQSWPRTHLILPNLLFFVATAAVSVHVGYLSLMARLCYWPGWVQAVAMIFTVLFVATMVWAGPRGIITLPLLLLLALYYRHIGERAFFKVDWLRLKPAGPIRRGPSSA